MLDLENRLLRISGELALGRQPVRADVDGLRRDVSALPRLTGSIPRWRLDEFDAAVKELHDQVVPLTHDTSREMQVPTQRPASEPAPRHVRGQRVARPTPEEAAAALDELRARVEALADDVDAGQKPARPVFEQLFDSLKAHSRVADCAEVRRLMGDVEALHRSVRQASRTAPRRQTSSRVGHGFWDRKGPWPTRRRRALRVSQPTRRRQPEVDVEEMSEGVLEAPRGGTTHAAERSRLIRDSRWLRDRAGRFAAAIPRGRKFPMREVQGLFHEFRIRRSHLDAETRALNDVAVRALVDAVLQVRGRADSAN